MPVVRPDRFTEPTQRSLLAEIELQAHRYNTRLKSTLIGHGSGPVGTIHLYERRVRGLRTGIYDGAVLLSPAISSAQERFRLTSLAPALSDVEVATLRIIGTRLLIEMVDHSPIDRPRAKATIQPYQIREVMPLEDTYQNFLQRLGRHTRRNIVHARNRAQREALKFDFSVSAPLLDDSKLSAIAKHNMPFPTRPSRILKMTQFLKTQARPFQASLCHSDAQPFSVAGGFIEGDMALMIYQINDRAFYILNPSLTLRSFLVQELIEQGVRHLAFVGGCSGVLYHQCSAVPAVELLIVRRKLIARVKNLACALIADRETRIARLQIPSGERKRELALSHGKAEIGTAPAVEIHHDSEHRARETGR